MDTVREFRIKLQGLSGAHEIYIYPNAGYGFANNDNPAFDPAAADVAWDRTKGVFGEDTKVMSRVTGRKVTGL